MDKTTTRKAVYDEVKKYLSDRIAATGALVLQTKCYGADIQLMHLRQFNAYNEIYKAVEMAEGENELDHIYGTHSKRKRL